MAPIVPLYAAVLALMFVVLALRTITLRHRFRVGIGDGDQALLRRAMRVHGNFAEYVPFALLLLYFVELRGANPYLVHALCSCLVAGRFVHAVGVSQVREPAGWRVVGMCLTFTTILTATALLLLR